MLAQQIDAHDHGRDQPAVEHAARAQQRRELLPAAREVVEVDDEQQRLGADERRVQDELIAGWANAACEVEPGERDRIRAWERERRSSAAEGQLEVVVGHEGQQVSAQVRIAKVSGFSHRNIVDQPSPAHFGAPA